jgi:hypothetical protein
MKLTAGCPQDKHFLLNCPTHAAFSPPQSPHTPAKFLLALLIPLFKKKNAFLFHFEMPANFVVSGLSLLQWSF